MQRYFVYILKSTVREIHYIGQTQNLELRLKHHNSPGAKWTKRFQPWQIIHSEDFLTRSEATKREKELKKLKDIKKFLKQPIEFKD